MTHYSCLTKHIPQFANVAWPMAALELRHDIRMHIGDTAPVLQIEHF